jgi:hypothetical protein
MPMMVALGKLRSYTCEEIASDVYRLDRATRFLDLIYPHYGSPIYLTDIVRGIFHKGLMNEIDRFNLEYILFKQLGTRRETGYYSAMCVEFYRTDRLMQKIIGRARRRMLFQKRRRITK